MHRPHKRLRGVSPTARPGVQTDACLAQPAAQVSCEVEDVHLELLVHHQPGVWGGEGKAVVAGKPFSGLVI